MANINKLIALKNAVDIMSKIAMKDESYVRAWNNLVQEFCREAADIKTRELEPSCVNHLLT